MDPETLAHLNKWIAMHVTPDLAGAYREAMIEIYLEDPERWGCEGWSKVFNAIAGED